MGDAINTRNALSQFYPDMIVRVGPAGGATPTESDTDENFHSVLVVQSASGSRLDFAQLQYKLEESAQNWRIPANFARMVEVRLPDTDETRIHLGDYVTERTQVQQDGEVFSAQSQLRNYHFGNPIVGYTVENPITEEDVVIQDHVRFNPMIDDKTRGNKKEQAIQFVHPETIDGADAEVFHNASRELWSLKDACRYICRALNGLEAFIRYPNYDEGEFDVLDGAPPIRNVTLQMGWYLPKCLDTLLIPMGYNWYVDYQAQKDPEGVISSDNPKITIFKIGEGDEKELKFPAVGEILDLENADVNQYSIDASIGDSFNAVDVYGQFEEVEVTLPLYPAWPADKDTISSTDLSKGGDSYEGNENVWRLFIANEAGDLDPTVTRLGQTPDVPDFSEIFTVFHPHRRTLQEPLTIMDDDNAANGKVRVPIKVEYSTDAGATWLPEESNWTIKLLPDQIGILFDSKDIPTELYDAGNNGRLRITGCIFGDSRIKGTAEKQAYAVNAREHKLVMFQPEKFQSRWRQSVGDYASVFASGTLTADEKDDTEEIQDYADKLRDQNQYADMECEFRLPGWHLDYKIGDLLTNIFGREVSLDSAPESAPSPRYCQIVERRFELTSAGPSTVLIVDRGVQQV